MTASHEKGTISKVFIALLILVISYSVFTIVLHSSLINSKNGREHQGQKKRKKEKLKRKPFCSLYVHILPII